MKTLVKTSLSMFAVLALATPVFAANAVRISQVYGGGGTISGSTAWDSDYVELFNLSGTPSDISGWTIEYALPTGAWGSSPANIFTFPADTFIEPCSYVLVAMEPGFSGASLPVTPDFNGTIAMSANNGKVGLFNAPNVNLACGSELSGTLVDKVSYGTANCSETSATPSLNVSKVDVRNGAGMVDTDNNSADFTVVVGAEPRSSESGINTECLATPSNNSTWGHVKSLYRH